MTAVFRREVGSYFKGVLGYLLAAFLLVFAGIYCMAYNLSGYYANFEYVLSGISFIYLIAVPIISMRAVAEEKRQKTDQLLYSLPIRLSSVVMGKYLAMLTVLAVPTLILCFPNLVPLTTPLPMAPLLVSSLWVDACCPLVCSSPRPRKVRFPQRWLPW